MMLKIWEEKKVLSHNKLDIIAWYLYLRSGYLGKKENNIFCSSNWARDVIKQITNIFSSDIYDLYKIDDKKLNFYKEVNNFLTSHKYQNFDEKFDIYTKSIDSDPPLPFKYVPIELDIAKALYLKSNITISDGWDEQDFLPKLSENDLFRNGISQIIIDELIREYICLDESIYAAVSGDGNPDIMQEISLKLGRFAEIICMKTMSVTDAGKKQWVRLQYAHESHWDERNMHAYMNRSGIGPKIPGSSVGVIFFQKKNKDHNIRDLKEKFRDSLSLIGRSIEIFPHVHITDTHLEVKWVANAILNRNSTQWMNRACDNYPKKFSILIQEYVKEMSLRNDASDFCLDTGGVLALHGIRDTGDIDYISIGDSEKPIVNDRIEKHNSQYEEYSKSVKEIIENPQYHFYYKNIKSSTISEVLLFKKYREKVFNSSPSIKKDREDILMIEKYLSEDTKSQVPKNEEKIKYKKKKEKDLKPNTVLRKISLILFSFIIFSMKIFKFLLKKILPFKITLKLSKMKKFLFQKRKLRLRKRILNTLG